LLSYLGGVLHRASAISCGSDAVTCPVTGRIITPLPHDIAQMLTSLHLNRNLSICRCRCRFHCRCRYHPFFAHYFHRWKCGLLSSIACVLLGGALIKKFASFRHKTQKSFFLAGSLSEFFCRSSRFADRPTSPIFQNPTHAPSIQCTDTLPPATNLLCLQMLSAQIGDVMTSPLPRGMS